MLNPAANLGIESHVAADELLRGIIELSSAAAVLPPPLPPLPGANGQIPPEEESWRENGLARQIADPKNVQVLVDWMLLDIAAMDQLNSPKSSEAPSPPPKEVISTILKTSSLIQSISVLVDLIRKNNSDFVEQQMLVWARRKEAMDLEREMLAEEMDQEMPRKDDLDRGPCLVDLSALLGIISEKLEGFQELLRNPRSKVSNLLRFASSADVIM